MNFLIIDDIKLIGNSIVIELAKNTIWNTITFYHYDVEDSFKNNVKAIASLIIKNKIDVLCLDRGYSKIYEDDENYIYSSIEEKHRGIKVKGEEVLLGQKDSNGLLEQLIGQDINLKSILLYTYDKGNNEIDILIGYIKETISKKLNSLDIKADLYCFETSSIFNKPLNTILYPDCIYISPTYKDQFIDYGKSRRNIGTKSAYIEYGQLIASIINDVVLDSARTIYSFFNSSNIQYDSFLRSINNLHINNRELRHEYYTDSAGNAQTQVVQEQHDFSKLNLSSVSALFNINDQEKYLVDIPFKEYYSELNESIKNKGLLSLFKDKDGYYLKNQFVIYCYNFIENKEFHLYECHTSSEIESKKEIIRAWLPILHSGAFHSTHAWQCEEIKDSIIPDADYRITMLFYFDILEVFGYNGHINFTFYQEGSISCNVKRDVEAIKNYKTPLLKAKASEVLIPELKIEIQKQAIRAAISQVMARNMSHNIGSHVMNKLIGDLRSLELLDFEKDKTSYKSSKLTELHGKIEEKLKKDDWYDKADAKLKSRALKNEIALKLISDFNSYVKCRMDYLADLTFGTPAMLSSKNVYTDIFEDLDKVRLLLDNISGRGQQFQYRLLFKDKDNQLNKETDFPVAIPNDVLGCQAFYNIIENVIRNTAKHSTNASIPIKEFTINFREIDEDEIDGNIDLWHEVQSLYCVEIYDNLPIDNIEALVKSQNLKINGKILDEENKLRGESLGMIEMDASAAYLRQLEIVEVDSDDYDVDEDYKIYNSKGKLNILKAFNKNGCLAYRFFIKKPQEVLIVTDNEDKKKELLKYGIWTTDVESFKQHLNQNRNYNHNFLVLEEGNAELKSLVAEREAAVTKRIYYKSANEINKLLHNETLEIQKAAEEIKLALWVSRESELYDIYKDALSKDENGNPDIYILPQLHNSYADFSNHLYKIADSSIPQDEWNKHCNNHFYYEGLSSKAQSVLPDFFEIVTNEQNEENKISKYTSSLADESNYQTKLKVGESILNRIIVLDERIQDKLNEKLYKIPYSEHFKMSGIFVPNKDFDLKADTIEIKEIEDFVNETMKKNNYGLPMNPEMDYLLIHYSLLERAFENEKEKNKAMELEKKEWVHIKLKDLSKKINLVVTSGRGNIQGLPDNVRFVNLSIITTALIDIKSKYLIHNILHSSRTT